MHLPPDYEWEDWAASDEPTRYEAGDSFGTVIQLIVGLVLIAFAVAVAFATLRPAAALPAALDSGAVCEAI